jgi:hypothetical protein
MSMSRIKAQKRQASVKIVDNEGQTALHLAAKARGNEEVIWLLLMAGATVDMQDGHGHTALRLAARESGENDVGWAEAALEWAMMKHDEIMVQHLLAQDVGATTTALGKKRTLDKKPFWGKFNTFFTIKYKTGTEQRIFPGSWQSCGRRRGRRRGRWASRYNGGITGG